MPATKRKQSSIQDDSSRKRRRVKVNHARLISTQTTGKAFGNGEIDVDKFVRAREFEIKALEDSMRRSKKGLSSRAFQDVPRELRRRTASHNVKRVPKRLRARAAKEMREDNTPTVSARTRKPTPHMRLRMDTTMRLKKLRSKRRKSQEATDGDKSSEKEKYKDLKKCKVPRTKKNQLQIPRTPRAKFRKRQIHKAWLPTHLFHAKRAHMTPPKEPLWRIAVPLSPTAKSYRPTHRASSLRGALAWDMSYMSTIGLEGPFKSLQNLFKAMGVGSDSGQSFWDIHAKRWMKGSRTWDGWLFEREAWPHKAIAPATIVWCAKQQVQTDDLSKSAKKKMQQDYRKAFVRVHPSAFHQLWHEMLRLSKIQKPSVTIEDLRFEIGSIEITGPAATEALVGTLWPISNEQPQDSPSRIWPTLASVPNLSTLPSNVLLAFDISDPRLHHPPKAVSPSADSEAHRKLLSTLATWPPDNTQTPPRLFDSVARYVAARSLPSQKAINRRRALADPGEYPTPSEKDPEIPILAYVSQTRTGNQSSWIVMMPWKCILPVWYSLMYCPLSTGGTARFGGLDERRQIGFESLTPWFPGDYPGTKAGMEWELRERARRKAEWDSKPKGKRVEWASVDLGEGQKGEIGLGWACDWNQLASVTEQSEIQYIPKSVAHTALFGANDGASSEVRSGLITVKITLLGRGVPTTCARLYRLPVDQSLRKEWLAMLPEHQGKDPSTKKAPRIAKITLEHVRRKLLAESLLDGSPDKSKDVQNQLRMPEATDLVGFVTTGNFNLGEGRATAIGCVSLRKLVEQDASETRRHRQICIIRQSGQSIGRLARWELA